MTEVEVRSAKAAKTERLAELTLKMLDRFFCDPSIKPRRLDDGTQLVTSYSYFGQCHIYKTAEGKFSILNFPEPCREVDLSKVLGSPSEIAAFGTARVLQMAQGLRGLLKYKNVLNYFKR